MYLKYDKKLIFSIKKLKIEPLATKDKFKFNPSLIGLTDEILNYFELIRIDDINYNKEHIFIEFKNNIFILKHNEADIKVNFKISKKDLLVDSSITLHKYNISVNSKTKSAIKNLSTNLNDLAVDIKSKIKHNDFEFNLKGNIKNGFLKYEVFSNKIHSLNFLKNIKNLDSKIEKMIFSQFEFDEIKLKSLKGKIKLEEINELNIKSLNATLTIEKPKIKYQKKPIFYFDKVLVLYENGKIDLSIKKDKNFQLLTFDGKINTTIDKKDININGKIFYEDFIFDTKSEIKIGEKYHINAEYFNMLNRKLYFKGNININPKNIFSKENIKLDIDDFEFIFEPKLPSLKAKKVYFQYLNDNIYLSFNKFFYDKFDLDGSKAVIENIISDKKTVLKLNIKTTSLLQSEMLNILKFYEINLPFYQPFGKNEVVVDLDIPFGDDPIEAWATVKSQNTQINFDNKSIPIKNLYLELDNKNNIKTTIKYNENNQSFELNGLIDINKNKSSGIININNFSYKDILEIKNEKLEYNMNFDKNITNIKVPKYGLNYKNFGDTHQIKIDYFNKTLKFLKPISEKTAIQSNLKLITNDNFINTDCEINNLYAKTNDLYFDKFFKDENKTKINLPKINLNLNNGILKHKDYDLIYGNIKADIEKSKIDIKYKKMDDLIFINLDTEDKKLNVKSDKLTYNFVNKLLKKELLQDGYISLNIKGTFDNPKGKILFYKTTIKNVQVLNNLIVFINTTPAIINPVLALPTLFRLGETGFDLQGYYVKSGWCEFDYNKKSKLLSFSDIYTKSKMMDFKARGNADLEKRIININTDVVFMKDYSKFLNHIPIVGHIITGDDGNFVTQVDIYGSLNDPKFETHTVKNATKGAAGVLKRVIETPFRILGNIFDINLTITDDNTTNHDDLMDKGY